MKKFICILPLFILLSCGGTGEVEHQESEESTVYEADHEWVLSATELKEKLGDLQASFTEIGNKEVEETVCSENSRVPYNGNEDEMNVWLMSTYMLDNFSREDFGKHNFGMPDVKMKNGVSLKELNWLNITSLDSTMFDLYKNHPGLNAIPKNVEGADGKPISNDEMVKKPGSILNALEDGLLAVIAITDYLPPSYSNEKEFETGYIMGYLMFADWKNGVLSCITPLLAENSTQIDFSNSSNIEDSPYSKEVMVMITDLQDQTYGMIDSIARMRTGFTGKVWVNNQDKLYQP